MSPTLCSYPWSWAQHNALLFYIIIQLKVKFIFKKIFNLITTPKNSFSQLYFISPLFQITENTFGFVFSFIFCHFRFISSTRAALRLAIILLFLRFTKKKTMCSFYLVCSLEITYTQMRRSIFFSWFRLREMYTRAGRKWGGVRVCFVDNTTRARYLTRYQSKYVYVCVDDPFFRLGFRERRWVVWCLAGLLRDVFGVGFYVLSGVE